ncbi:MAG: HAD hydrolase-like protein, partial [Actinomycetota bacterium]
AVLDGARLIGTNGDSTYPTPRGLEPGGGSLVRAVATVAGVEPVIGGKPHRPMADLIDEMVGPGFRLMVGDRFDTDGAFAATLDCPFALVRSGVVRAGDPLPGDAPIRPRFDVADLGALADALDPHSTALVADGRGR